MNTAVLFCIASRLRAGVCSRNVQRREVHCRIRVFLRIRMRWLVAVVVVAAVAGSTVIGRPKGLRRHCSSRDNVSRSGGLCRSATLEARRLQHSSSRSLRKCKCTRARRFDDARAGASADARAGARAGARASWQRADRWFLRHHASRHAVYQGYEPQRARRRRFYLAVDAQVLGGGINTHMAKVSLVRTLR